MTIHEVVTNTKLTTHTSNYQLSYLIQRYGAIYRYSFYDLTSRRVCGEARGRIYVHIVINI